MTVPRRAPGAPVVPLPAPVAPDSGNMSDAALREAQAQPNKGRAPSPCKAPEVGFACLDAIRELQ